MKNIAIIGSGIAGLTSAYLLSREHHVTVFEKNNYVGGHTATKDITFNHKSYAIDTGFIVCNDRTYPNFLTLLSQLNVGLQETEMSFSVLNKRTGLEYNGHGLNSLFAQRRNLLNPKFWRLIKDILSFNKQCKELYHKDNIPLGKTLGEFLTEHKYSDYFGDHYILPMGAAIWSTSLKEMRNFELRFFVRFFYNHGLLNVSDRPQWYVVEGGSRNYIPALTRPYQDNIELNSHIKTVVRNEVGVSIIFDDGTVREFDEVVFACHSDQALALMDSPTRLEQEILGDIPYSRNEVVLHHDINVLPKRKLAWASWNYLLSDNANDSQPASVTYNMNILQGITSPTTFCVTLNQSNIIAHDKVIEKYVYHHPVFNTKSMSAQRRRDEICGKNYTHFVGAYWYSGFHEDGVNSALDVAKRFGISL
jgi:predicted NAD/FAD-binding protein